jgi:hypothetical protein
VIRWLCVAAATAAVAAGCGGSASGSTVQSGPAASAPATIDPTFDTGQTVLITAGSVRPLWLVSLVGKPIVFQNTTGSVMRVVFDHQPVRSGPIPPGGVFRYTPKLPLSVTYHVGPVQGKIQVSSLEGASP